MILKILASLIILSIAGALLLLFVVPEKLFSPYIPRDFTKTLQDWKGRFNSGIETMNHASGGSLWQKVQSGVTSFTEESTKTYTNIQDTVQTEQKKLETAGQSLQKTYNSLQETKSNIEGLVQFGSGSK